MVGLVVSGEAKSATGAIILEQSRTEQSVAGHLSILEDPSGLLDLRTVASDAYRETFTLYDTIPQFSRTKSAYWARFSLQNNTAQHLVRLLVLNYPNHQKATLYMSDGNGGYVDRTLDARRLVRDVDIIHRLPVYRATINAGETATFYWRIESATVRPNIEIWNPAAFIERRVSEEWWYLVFLGVTLATWLYGATLMVTSGGRLYMALFIVASCALMLQFVVQGHQYLLFGRFGGAFTVAYLLAQSWTAGAIVNFSIIFLGIEARKSYLRTGFRMLAVVFFGIGLWSLTDYLNAMKIYQFCVLGGAPLLLSLGIKMAWSGSRAARLFLAAWSPLIVMGSLIALNATGIVGNVALGAQLMVAFIPTTLLAFGFSIMYRVTRERIEKERFMRSVEMKSSFLATMSHEIRTPLTGVLGMAELLRRTSLSIKQKEYVDTIRSSGGMLMALLDDVLQMTKAESGRLPERRESFEPRQLVDSLVRLFSGQARKKGIALHVAIEPDVPDVLIGDVGRIRQALLNLISNAVKFTMSGQVRVSVTSPDLKNEKQPDDLRRYLFTVEDSGIGISEDARLHLFERFSQADKSTSQHYGGTGLGLAISRELIEDMGGKIDYESIEGSGSRFFLSLPLTEGRAKVPEKMAEQAMNTDLVTGRVLVVDDVETNRVVIIGLLNAEGIPAESAVNGRDALAKLADGEYDLVVMDIHMPELDGMAATRQLRQNGNPIPIIGLSASVLPEEREQYLAAGMNEVLDKPIDPDAMIQAIYRGLKQIDRPLKGRGEQVLINQALHERHQDVLGVEKWAEMIVTFRTESSAVIEILKEAVRNRDMDEVEVHSHRLIGMVGFLGLDALGVQTKAVLDAVRIDGGLNVMRHVEKLEDTYLATLRQL